MLSFWAVQVCYRFLWHFRKITRSVNVLDEISIARSLTVRHQFGVLKDLRMLVSETVKAPGATVR